MFLEGWKHVSGNESSILAVATIVAVRKVAVELSIENRTEIRTCGGAGSSMLKEVVLISTGSGNRRRKNGWIL